MAFKKQLKTFLFPAANILLALLLLKAFFILGQNVVKTYPIAKSAALSYLKPAPADYFWELNMHQAPMQKDQIGNYRDYYEYLLQVFPYLSDAYGILGYCYHYLGNDDKAIDDLKKAIASDPEITWNYYNLALIYIEKSRYQEASLLLQKLHTLDLENSIKRMFTSQIIYGPLLAAGGRDAFRDTVGHLKESLIISFILLRELNQTSDTNAIDITIKKMNLELYAF